MGILGMIGASLQNKAQRKLMDKQHKNQMSLNRQGHGLQMDMWNKTNYGAQVDHMRDAGLNPALMYQQGGSTGTTGSQGGGSASSGNAAQVKMFDLQNILLGKQAKALESKANLDQANADKIAGVDTKNTEQLTKESVAKELKAIQEKSESQVRQENLELEKEIKQIDANWLRNNKTSTYEQQVIRSLKAMGLSLWEILKFWGDEGKNIEPKNMKDIDKVYNNWQGKEQNKM